MKNAVLRIARACRHPEALAIQYTRGLGFETLAEWRGHEGYDGIVLGHAQAPYHLEFIHARNEPDPPAPHPEHLLVFYVGDTDTWQRLCDAMLAAEFATVVNDNPYWERNGRTFADAEGGRVVLNRGAWPR
jgi:YycE-like N-terminal domain/YycE-like C-terminal domain